jgi:hypothetical protein
MLLPPLGKVTSFLSIIEKSLISGERYINHEKRYKIFAPVDRDLLLFQL